MASVDRHFCKVAHGAMRELLHANEDKLGRSFVKSILREFDPSGNRDAEDNAFDFADRVYDILDRRDLARDYNDDDLMKAVTKVVQRMVDNAERENRRNDRGDRRSRSRGRDYDDREDDRGGWGSARSRGGNNRRQDDRFDGYCDDRETPRRNQEETRRQKHEPQPEESVVSKNVNPLAHLREVAPSEFAKIDLPEEMCDLMKGKGFILKTESYSVDFHNEASIRIYSAKSKEAANTSFEHLKKFFEVFPDHLKNVHTEHPLPDLWTVLLTVPVYRSMEISLDDYTSIRTRLKDAMIEGSIVPVNAFCEIVDNFPRRVWKVISREMVRRFNLLSTSYMRSELCINDVVTVDDLDWLQKLSFAEIELKMKHDERWQSTYVRIVNSIIHQIFFTEINNIPPRAVVEGDEIDWSAVIAYDAVTFDPKFNMLNKFDILKAATTVAQNVVDDINRRMVFWSEPVTLLVTNMLSEKTIKRIPMGVTGVNAPDYEAFRGILSGLPFIRSKIEPSEVYTTLFRESPSTFLRQFDLIVPMTPNSKHVTISARKQTVLGM